MKTLVPVFLCSSNQYAPYAAVALRSLIAHASAEKMYHVYIFHNGISANNLKKIARMQTENVQIIFRDIGEIGKEGELYVSAADGSKETYYRIFGVECLKEYEKLIYLDCDIVLLRDIAELYDEDIGQSVLGAIQNYNDYGSLRYIESGLKIPPERCFNAGVLLINTKKFIDMEIRAQCMQMLTQIKKPLWADQDLLNLVCWQNTKLLDERWNLQCHGIVNERGKKPEQLEAILNKAVDDPFIVHYSGIERPWLVPRSEFAEYFWKYARQTEFYEEIIYRNASHYQDENQAFFKYLFPFDRVKKGSRVVLYGMGKVGFAFYAQNQLTNYCQMLFCADRNYQQLAGGPIPVLSPETLKNDIFDFVVIAIENEGVRNAIVRDLEGLGVAPEKIVAENPLKS